LSVVVSYWLRWGYAQGCFELTSERASEVCKAKCNVRRDKKAQIKWSVGEGKSVLRRPW
jgi:hypothetical protein